MMLDSSRENVKRGVILDIPPLEESVELNDRSVSLHNVIEVPYPSWQLFHGLFQISLC